MIPEKFFRELVVHHKPDLKDPLVVNSFYISMSRIIDVGFGFLFWLVAARVYPIAAVGTGSALLAVLGLVILASRMGFDVAIIRYLPERDKASVFSTSLWTTTLFCLFISIVSLIFVPVISPTLSGITEFPVLFVLFCCASSIVSITGTMFTAMRRSSLRFIQNIVMGLRVPLLLPFAILGGTGVLFAIGGAYILAAIAGLAIIIKSLSLIFSLDYDLLQDTIRFNFVNYTSSIIHNLPALVLPILLLNLTDSGSVALFSIAFAFYNLLGVIPESVAQSFFVEGSHGTGLKKSVYQSIFLSYVFLIPAVLILIVRGDWILGLFGPLYLQAAFLLILLAVSRLFYSFYTLFISFQLIRWKPESLVWTSICSSGMTLGLSTWLIPSFGIVGTGFAFLISNIVMAGGVLVFVRYHGWA